jgi:hypothetical protein
MNLPHGARVLRNSEHSLHAADHAARNSSDGSANGTTDRPGRTVADGSPLFCSTDNPLCLHRNRRGEDRQSGSRKDNKRFHRQHS